MSDLVQIEKGWQKRRMKDGTGEFVAKKSEGGGWYQIKEPNGKTYRHLAKVVEELSEEVKG